MSLSAIRHCKRLQRQKILTKRWVYWDQVDTRLHILRGTLNKFRLAIDKWDELML